MLQLAGEGAAVDVDTFLFGGGVSVFDNVTVDDDSSDDDEDFTRDLPLHRRTINLALHHPTY